MNFLKLSAVSLLAFNLAGCGEVIDTGHRGVKTKYGKVSSESLEEGLYFYNPFTSTIIEMDARTQKYEVETTAYTKDVQQATFGVAVNYNLEKTKVHEVYANVGRDWEDKLIPQTVASALKTVVGKWDAVELIANRDKAQQAIQDAIAATLSEKFIYVTRVEIASIDFSDEFEKAVEAKVTAIQQAEKEKNATVQIQEQANQRIISAKAEAESMSIRAQALTQNKALVEYEAVQKWNGVLPQYMLGGSTPFVNIK